MKNKIILLVIVMLSLVGASAYVLTTNNSDETNIKKVAATLYKRPTCGCCIKYGAFLEKKDFVVDQKNLNSLVQIKKEYNIPKEMQSCHTTIVGKYFVEGHVPIEAVTKLLTEQPDIDGIALPGMPIGTPGMPGPKKAPYVIYQLKDGEYSVYMTI